MSPPKFSRYQDYVIRDGTLIGDFEAMYQDHPDPWGQTDPAQFTGDRAAALAALNRLKCSHGPLRVVELGCGLGEFTSAIAGLGFNVCGIDVSQTAVAKARLRHPGIEFRGGHLGDHDLIRSLRPDIIVLAEVTWYVLAEIREFLDFSRRDLPHCFMLHLLTTYRSGEQRYGTEFFTDLDGIKRFFGLRYLESGAFPESDGCAKTWFFAAPGGWEG